MDKGACCTPKAEAMLLERMDMLVNNATVVADMAERVQERLFGSNSIDCNEKSAPPANMADKMSVCKNEIDRAGKTLQELLDKI